ncbi:16399_t:CDS:1, partial [Acaulospora colombiana]
SDEPQERSPSEPPVISRGSSQPSGDTIQKSTTSFPGHSTRSSTTPEHDFLESRSMDHDAMPAQAPDSSNYIAEPVCHDIAQTPNGVNCPNPDATASGPIDCDISLLFTSNDVNPNRSVFEPIRHRTPQAPIQDRTTMFRLSDSETIHYSAPQWVNVAIHSKSDKERQLMNQLVTNTPSRSVNDPVCANLSLLSSAAGIVQLFDNPGARSSSSPFPLPGFSLRSSDSPSVLKHFSADELLLLNQFKSPTPGSQNTPNHGGETVPVDAAA